MIKLLIPDMPSTAEILPYLKRIDENKQYVNGGPLAYELELRIEQITNSHCALVCNGTLAIELAIIASLASRASRSDIAMLPAFTFAGTGLAARNSGINLALKDVDEDSWHLRPLSKYKFIENKPDITIPVAALGRPVNITEWERYFCPVIIDAAGAFMVQQISSDENIAACFSMHATKFLGCGEGGFVVSANQGMIDEIKALSNFGENGTNAKISEYHAAVALAAMDRMVEKTERTSKIAAWYHDHLQKISNCKTSMVSKYSTMLNVKLPIPAEQAIRLLAANGIESKQWYRPYLNERDEFYKNVHFTVTNDLAKHLIGIPFHNFLTESEIEHVCNSIQEICHEQR